MSQFYSSVCLAYAMFRTFLALVQFISLANEATRRRPFSIISDSLIQAEQRQLCLTERGTPCENRRTEIEKYQQQLIDFGSIHQFPNFILSEIQPTLLLLVLSKLLLFFSMLLSFVKFPPQIKAQINLNRGYLFCHVDSALFQKACTSSENIIAIDQIKQKNHHQEQKQRSSSSRQKNSFFRRNKQFNQISRYSLDQQPKVVLNFEWYKKECKKYRFTMKQEQYFTHLKDQQRWSLVDLIMKENPPSSLQINSYNRFTNDLSELIRQQGRFSLNLPPQFNVGQSVGQEQIWDFQFSQITTDKRGPIFRTIGDTEITLRSLTPNICRLRDLTYHTVLKANIQFIRNRVKSNGQKQQISTSTIRGVTIAEIPVMVGSNWCNLIENNSQEKVEKGECPYDQGGYFIVKGSEKVIVGQERMAYNQVFVFTLKLEREPWIAQVRSIAATIGALPQILKLSIKLEKGQPRILCKVKNIGKDVPLGLLMRALGIQSDKQILESVCQREMKAMGRQQNRKQVDVIAQILKSSFDQVVLSTQQHCLMWLGQHLRGERINDQKDQERCKHYAKQMLNQKLLPHLGTQESCARKKAYFLGYMARRLINCYIGASPEDDRDHYGKKRVQLTGVLMLNLFRQLFKGQFIQSAKAYLRRNRQKGKDSFEGTLVQNIFDHRPISNGLRNALATGSWNRNAIGQPIRTGVSQVLKRDTSYFATLSHLRRVVAPILSSSKSAKPRLLHNTHFGIICPSETPQGQKIGIVKNFSLLAKVSQDLKISEQNQLFGIIRKHSIRYDHLVRHYSDNKHTKILVNGNLIAYTDNPIKFVQLLKSFRRDGSVADSISIIYDHSNGQIRIGTDGGRCMRPLLVVVNNQILLQPNHMDQKTSTQSLKNAGLIQYLDIDEEETCLIAMQPRYLENKINRYTHCEIHPSMIFGICGSLIPFPNHNQATKNTLQSAMSKQAMGINGMNTQLRMQTLNHQLYYPQRPLVTTIPTKYISVNLMPTGVNTIVAMACFTGYNQEDSIVINQSSIERGLFRSAFYRTYKTQQMISIHNRSSSKICRPTIEDAVVIEEKMSRLDIDGILSPGSIVDNDQVLVGKVLVPQRNFQDINDDKKRRYRDVSLRLRRGQKGVVDSVVISSNAGDNKIIKSKVRSIRIPQIGDKFASRHGQKGTCGMTLKQQDLPFTMQGIIPDLIVNPHCIPSRMTIGHLLQCMVSKSAAIHGKVSLDATPFRQYDINVGSSMLHEKGYQRYGNQQMFNPYSGKMFENPVFIGPIYYQRLRHMVDDKVYARSRGPIVAITRQPTHGRSRGGGLRFGEMERDGIISHGATSFLRERLLTVSDEYSVHVCSKCGLMANFDRVLKSMKCKHCKSSQIVQVTMPYAAKQLMQELTSMHILPRLNFITKNSIK